MENAKVIQSVVNKAWDDPQFKSDLVASPKAAIEAATGTKIPDGVKIVVTDQTDTSKVYVNLPPKPDFDNMELTDEQLEQVAGGEFFVSAAIVTAVSATIAASIGAASATIAALIPKW